MREATNERRDVLIMKRIWMAMGVALGLALPVLGFAADKAAASKGASERLVRNGVVVEYSAIPVGKSAGLMEGEFAEVRFKITNEATGEPIKSAGPGAWMDMSEVIQGKPGAEQKSCKDKISLYLKGAVGIRPMVDLNSYYVLTLNKDSSVSVVDPIVSMVGSTSTLATVNLKGPGMDWVSSETVKRTFISIPKAGQVAVFDTDQFKLAGYIDAGSEPVRVALQPDQRFLWVGNNATEAAKSGVTVIDVGTEKAVGFIPTGAGHHEIAFSADSRHAFVTNRDAGTVTVIDVARRAKVKDLKTGGAPLAAAWSSLSRAVYVADGKTGTIAVIDSEKLEVSKTINVKPGLGPLRVTQDGRFALVVNPSENAVFVVDTSVNEFVQTVPIKARPFQITFSETFAYVRSLGSERVSMINLSTLGKGREAAVQSFPAGSVAPGNVSDLVLADLTASAPAEGTVFVVNPAEGTTYYYAEGMNAPSSNYRVYGSSPRAVTVIDRSLKEVEPGVYSGRVKIPAGGKYDVAFMLQTPTILHCFSAQAETNPALAKTRDPVVVEFSNTERLAKAGDTLALRFKLVDPATHKAMAGVADVRVMYFLAPGRNRREVPAKEIGDGMYEAQLPLESAGAYYAYVGIPSLKMDYGKLPAFTLQAKSGGQPGSALPERAAGAGKS